MNDQAHLPLEPAPGTLGAGISVKDVTVTYRNGFTALRDATLTVGSNELVGLIGPNGAGKTTLLGSVAGLLRPAAGRVELAGGGAQREEDEHDEA